MPSVSEYNVPMRLEYYHNTGLRVFLFALVAISLFASPGGVFAEDTPPLDEKVVTITGSVETAAVDDKGAVVAVEIWVEHGDEFDYYLVNDTPKGMELIASIGKKVTATGILEEDEDGNKIITVRSFSAAK
jgi:hypothetical protein